MRQKASEKLAKILPDIKYHGTLRTSVSADDFRAGREAKQESETILSVRGKGKRGQQDYDAIGISRPPHTTTTTDTQEHLAKRLNKVKLLKRNISYSKLLLQEPSFKPIADI